MDDDLWVPLAILGTYLTMLAGERFFAARRFESVPRWRWIGWAFLLMLFVVNGLLPALLPMDVLAERALLPGHRLGVAGGVLVGVLAFTLVDYGVHRALHRFNLLWRIHQVHHSASRVDIYGSAVLHPLEVALFVMEGILVNVFVLGLDPRAVAIAGYLGAFMAMFQHWNVHTPRWLGWFIQRPEAHVLHHERHVHGRNYSNLPLWDMLFGTYANPLRVDVPVGFEGGRGRHLWAMLLGRDVNQGAQQPVYQQPALVRRHAP